MKQYQLTEREKIPLEAMKKNILRPIAAAQADFNLQHQFAERNKKIL
jgi:hypothetical protein